VHVIVCCHLVLLICSTETENNARCHHLFFVLVELYVTGSRVHWEYCAVSFSVEKNLLTVEENDKFLFYASSILKYKFFLITILKCKL
jgi:hypothetical protein